MCVLCRLRCFCLSVFEDNSLHSFPVEVRGLDVIIVRPRASMKGLFGPGPKRCGKADVGFGWGKVGALGSPPVIDHPWPSLGRWGGGRVGGWRAQRQVTWPLNGGSSSGLHPSRRQRMWGRLPAGSGRGEHVLSFAQKQWGIVGKRWGCVREGVRG